MAFDLSTAKPVRKNSDRFDVSTARPVSEGQESFLTREAPAIGGMVGGIGGAIFGGGIPGGIAGTAAGASLGNLYQDLQRQGTPQAPQTSYEAAKKAVGIVGWNVIGQGAGDVAGNLATRTLIAPSARSLIRPTQDATEAQRILQRGGGSLSMSQTTENPMVHAIEDISRVGITGKGVWTALDAKNKIALIAEHDRVLKSLTSFPADQVPKRGGLSLQRAISAGEEGFSNASRTMYADLDKEVQLATGGQQVVDNSAVKSWASKEADKYIRNNKVIPSSLQEAMNLPEFTTFADAQFNRTLALTRQRDLERGVQKDSIAHALYQQTQSKIAQSMDEAAAKLPVDIYSKYRRVSEFYKRGKDAFTNDIVAKVMEKDPARVAEYLFAKGNEREIVQARTTLRQAAKMDPSIDSAKVWNNMRAAYVENLLGTRAAQTTEGAIAGENVMKTLNELKASRTFRAAFTDVSQRESITKFLQAAYLSQREPTIKALSVAVPIFQAGAIGGLVVYPWMEGSAGTGESAAKAVGILVAPRILAKMMTSPRTVNLLTKAMDVPYGSSMAGGISAKILLEHERIKQETAVEDSQKNETFAH
jgi:hypothetical protein